VNNISRESDTPVISGSDADDVLRGSGIFEGGKGNDTIYAEKSGSEDTLRFNLGDGQDTIISDDWDQVQDTVLFGKGITQEMVGFVRSVDDLIVTVGDNGDQMTFRGFFAERDRQTFTRFEFADGSVWRNIRATEQWKSIDSAPVTRGTDADDRLRGSGIIEGGKGNDTLYADEWGSKDTLRFNLGDGQDTIYSYDLIDSGVQDIVQFGKGITQEMVGFARSGDNLVVMVGDSGDQMTFRDFFADTSSQTFTRFEFADKSVWGNIKESKTWKESIDKPAYSANDMPRPASSFCLESSVANQANSLLTAMATFAPQEGGIGFLPENNAQSAPILSASSVS